jgi:hypothetical protein
VRRAGGGPPRAFSLVSAPPGAVAPAARALIDLLVEQASQRPAP